MTETTPPCPRCGAREQRIGPGKGPHVAALLCARCGRWLARISKAAHADMTEGEIADAMTAWSAKGGRQP
jgi:hypothetical protein